MKKIEPKAKSSKKLTNVKGSAAVPKPTKPAISTSKKAAPIPNKELKVKSGKSLASKPLQVKPEAKPPVAMSAADRLKQPASMKKAKTPKVKEPKSKEQKAVEKKPQKLVQVVPTHKPSQVPVMPVKKEKMLMRFGKPAKRVLFKVDFLLKASPTIVYHFITTPSCLVRWFCDAVDITGEYYTFSWKGNTEVAEVLDDIEDERIRFHWLDGEDEEEFFEFRISTSDITDETILDIYDFAWADEVEEQKQLWRTQVDRLRKETGDQ